jgi:solute carrier family 29 (equilibrative nucleoside transporter), member 1/2/3
MLKYKLLMLNTIATCRYALVLIASYSIWDLIGRYLPLINCIKLTSRKGLLVITCLRFLFVPAFYYAVKYVDQGWVIMLTSFLGLSNGYLTVCPNRGGQRVQG